MRIKFFILTVCLSLLLLLCGCNTAEEAEDPVTIVWEKTFDSGNDDIAWDVAVDAEGSVYVTGNVNNGTDLDWHIIKYDAGGNALWTKTWDSGNGEDQAVSIAVDNTGNVYVSGWFNNGTDQDIRLVKYDTNGNLIWVRTYDSGGDDWGYSVTVDNTGNIYLAGREGFGTSTDDIYCAKYDPAGNKVWEKQYDLYYAESAGGIAVDAAGFVYMYGYRFTSEPGDGYDLLTLKCDANNGDIIWSRTFDTGKGDYVAPNGIAVDNAGNIYICGWFENDSTPSTHDWFVIKYDGNGTIVWNKIITSDLDEAAFGITVDSEGFIYVTGTIEGYCTHKLDSDGNVIWETIPGTGTTFGVAVDGAGFVYITGDVNNGTDNDYLTIKYKQN